MISTVEPKKTLLSLGITKYFRVPLRVVQLTTGALRALQRAIHATAQRESHVCASRGVLVGSSALAEAKQRSAQKDSGRASAAPVLPLDTTF